LASWASHGNAQGSSIWRLSSDGSNPVQLTQGPNDTSPTCSPDGKWVYYIDGLLTVMRAPLTGGMREVVPSTAVPQLLETQGSVDFSPDGKRMVLYLITHVKNYKSDLYLIDMDAKSASVPRQVDADARLGSPSNFTGGARFGPDSKSLVYPIAD